MISNKRFNINNDIFKQKIKYLTNDLNDIFKNVETEIKDILNAKNIKTRTRKISFMDSLCYKFKYAKKHTTQKEIINDHKYENNIICNNTAFYKKENKIPLEYYDNIHNRVLSLHNKYVKKSKYNIVGIDGTYNNTNLKNDKKLETSLNMGFYNITHKIPLELKLKGERNTEIESFISILNDNKFDTEDIIFVFDRAYYSYDLINYLDSKNIKFVIRIKNNCLYINNKKGKKSPKQIPEHCRFINYSFYTDSLRELLNKKTQNTDLYKVTQKISCSVVTNLNDKFKDDDIRQIYNSWWQIEEFFKLVKSNFRFSNLREHNKNTDITYHKLYYIIRINCILENIFESICDSDINYNSDKFNIKIDKTAIIKGLFKVVPDIIFSRLTYSKLLCFFNTYINFCYCKKDAHNPRTSKIPFSKWYVKDYHAKYDIEKIFDAYNDPDIEINKNLKSKSKDITFEKINT